MVSLDYSVVYQMILFLLLWLVLTPILFRPYLRLIEERERRTAGAQHDSADLAREGERLKAQYDASIAQAQVAAARAKEEVLQDARRQREHLIGDARDAATRILEQVRQEIQLEMEKENERATAEAGLIAEAMVSKILGRRVG